MIREGDRVADKERYSTHLPLTWADEPYKKVSVSSEKKKLIKELRGKHGNKPNTIIASAKRKGVKLTKDEVLTVLHS